ncbi:MAG: 5'-nucleotidase C-terminal domain-containing protein [Clostridia bacterium]
MKTTRKLSALFLALTLLLTLFTPAALATEDAITLTILESSDLHGSIASYDYAVDAATKGSGLARISTIVKAEREKDPELLLVDCGDTLQGNMISLFNNDLVHPMIGVMNLMDYDVWNLGNHEFNYDFSMLTRAISHFQGDVLIANAYQEDGARWQKPYVIREVKGVKVGMFGINAPHITQWEASNPEHYNLMTFTNPMDETKAMVAELRPQVDVLIGIVHYGKDGEYNTAGMYEVADAFPEVDAFMIGHAHEAFAEVRENGVAILEPGSNGTNLAKLTIKLQKDGDKFKIVEKLPELIVSADFEEDPAILLATRYVHDASVMEANTVVGTVADNFLPSLNWHDLPGIPTAQIQDTALVDLINEVQLFYTGADVSLAALFSSKSDLVKGDYKKKDAVNVYKYDNTLMAAKLTGAQLKAIMEKQAGAYFNAFTPGDVTISFNPEIRMYNYDMFAGVNYEIDLSKPVGERIVNLMFKGEPLKDDQPLVLALNNYRYGGLVTAGLLDKDSLVFDSTVQLSDTPAVRDLISVYAQKMGELVPHCDDNWKLVGIDLSDPDAETIYQLVRDGVIAIPTSEDGRTPNIESLNADKLREEGVIPAAEKPAA